MFQHYGKDSKGVAVLLLILFSFGCATLPVHPCTTQVNTPKYMPGDAERTISQACHSYENRTGREATLDHLTIEFHRDELPCSRRQYGCAFLFPDGRVNAHVLRGSKWRQTLTHEIYHSLLWKHEPDLEPHRHHSRMLELRLCSPDLEACGHQAGPTPQSLWD